MELTISITLDAESFTGSKAADEVSRILGELSGELTAENLPAEQWVGGTLFDTTGAITGNWEVRV